MKTYKLTLAVVGLASTLLMSGISQAEDAADPVAVVNGEPISKALFDAYAQQRQAQVGDISSPEVRKSLVDEMVVQELLVQEAKKQNLDENPEIALQKAMVDRSLLATAAVREYMSERAPTEEDIQQEYEKAVGTLSKKEYKARHILVDSEDKAKDIIGKLQAGGDFAELATANSSDQGSAANGGDLGWFSSDVMVKPFSEAVSEMDKGTITETPVQTQFGWHVIQLEDVRDAAPPPIEQLRPQLNQMLQAKIFNEYLEGLRSGAEIEIK